MKKTPIFSFAGIWDAWRNPETGEILQTYSIVTTKANELMRRIHNTNSRMPVIVAPQEEKRWLDAALIESEIRALMQPHSSGGMAAHVIGRDFLRRNPHDPAILRQAEIESMYNP